MLFLANNSSKTAKVYLLIAVNPKFQAYSYQLSTINLDAIPAFASDTSSTSACPSFQPPSTGVFHGKALRISFGKSLFQCFLWHIHVLCTNMYFTTMYILQVHTYNTIQYNTLHYTTITITIQYNTIQYKTIQDNTIQYKTRQDNTIQYIHSYLYIPIKHLWIYPVNTWVISSFLQHQLIEFRQLTTLLSHGPVPSPLAVSADDARNEWHVHLVLRHLWPP